MTPETPSTASSGEVERRHPTQRVVFLFGRGLGYFVYAYVIVVEIILTLGFVLLLFGANPSASFVEWVYRNLDRVMQPFRGIFTPIELGTVETGEVEAILETSVLFAMIVYGIVAIAIHGLITWLGGRIDRLDAEDREARRRRTVEDSTTVYREVTTRR